MYVHPDYKKKRRMTCQEQVKTCLPRDIDMMSECSAAFAKNLIANLTSKRKLPFHDLLCFLITMESGSTGHELLKYFHYSADTMSNAAFIQQRKKLVTDALPYLLRRFNAHFSLQL